MTNSIKIQISRYNSTVFSLYMLLLSLPLVLSVNKRC